MRIQVDDLEPFEKELLAEARAQLASLRETRSGCPTVRLIRAAQAGALSEDLQSVVVAHIGACRLCQRIQADLEILQTSPDFELPDVDRILARLPRNNREKKKKAAWLLSLKTAFVAAGLVLCGILIWQFRKPPSPGAPSLPVASIQKIPPASGPSSVLELQKPEVKFTLAVLTWRGTDNRRDEFLKEIAPALDAYRADKFAEAAAQLSALSSKYTDSVEVWFYLGVSRLFLSDHAGARDALEKAARLQDKSFAADISWYLGLAYHYSHRTREAHALFSKLCGEDGEYAARGCAAAKELSSALKLPR